MTTFEPSDLAELADPYPALAELRRIAPILRLQSGFWAVTGYEAAMEVFRERACASGPIAQRYVVGLPAGAARDEMSHRINFLDPPDHTRVRGLVSKAFTPRRIADLVAWLTATAERLLDQLEAEREIDLLPRFAHQLPSLAISELLGVPAADRDQLTSWSDRRRAAARGGGGRGRSRTGAARLGGVPRVSRYPARAAAAGAGWRSAFGLARRRGERRAPEPSRAALAGGDPLLGRLHYCLGASLARTEAEVMLAALARRWPDLALVADRPLRWHQRGPFRGLDALVVTRAQ